MKKRSKICASLMKNLQPHKRYQLVILLTHEHFHYSLITRKAQNIKPMTRLKVFCRNIFERKLSHVG